MKNKIVVPKILKGDIKKETRVYELAALKKRADEML
jgi:hypothetical protein